MAFKKITQEELDEILEQHHLWLETEGKEGNRANLSKVNLGNFNLERVNLSKANLKGASLIGANLSQSKLSFANLSEAYMMFTDLSETIMTGTNLEGANLFRANLKGSVFPYAKLDRADFSSVDLSGAMYLRKDFSNALNVSSKLSEKDSNERPVSNKEIEELREKNKELSEKAKNLEEEREEGKINTEEFKKQNQDLAEKNKLLELQLLEAEERARREITKDNIDKAIDALKNPNAYIENQITIQNILAFIYGVFALMSFIVMIRYISVKYEVFGSMDFQKATIISWLFYVSPIVLLGSLAIALINQVNHRLKRILVLNERKRYVEAMGGALKATVELSETDADAREKIEGYMDTIVKNTISRKVDVLNLEEKESDEVKSLEILDKIKSILKG